MRWAATLGLLVAALAGLMVEIIPWMPDRYHLDLLSGYDLDLNLDQAISPLWFTAACLVSAALLWWDHGLRAVPVRTLAKGGD